MSELKPFIPQKGISGSALKIIAIFAMLLDHIGAVFLGAYTGPYLIFRSIGRIAFPIFCFLLAEGFFHTKNIAKYCFRLGIFALISEIPFDLAFSRTVYDPDSQNVFFTLLIGLVTIACMDLCKNIPAGSPGIWLLCFGSLPAAGMALAWLLNTDYAEIGVLSVVLLYLFHNKRTISVVCVCLTLCCLSELELAAFAAVPLILYYNGRRGIALKYIFYIFYPAHLLVLFLLDAYLL